MTEDSSAEASEMDHVKKGKSSSSCIWRNVTHLCPVFDTTELKELKTKGKTELKDMKQDFHELKQDFGRVKSIFRKAKDKLTDHSQSSSRPSPSPSEITTASTSSNKDSAPKEKVKMSLSLASLIVYTVGVKCRGFNKKERYATEHVFSLSEKTANKILKESMGDLIKHNRTHVVRVYPNGMRVDSSNYEPHKYWASGTQLVAINWQTFGEY